MKVQGRIALLALGALALVLPASAGAKTATKHHLEMFKAEQHVTLPQGETNTYSLSCANGAIATDGMWRIDEVGPYNPQLADPGEHPWTLGTGVSVLAAYPSGESTYTFRIRNNTSQDAQLKLFLTCLGKRTAADTETHSIEVKKLRNQHGHSIDYVDYPHFSGDVTDANRSSCKPGQLYISPGFDVRHGNATLFASAPGVNDASGLPLSKWTYGFYVDGSASIRIYGKCLELKTGWTNHHKHALYAFLKDMPQETFSKGNHVWEHQTSCGEHQKALVAGFSVWQHGANFHDQKRWWLGMDPRIKARAFKTLGDNGGRYYTVCVNDRTSRPLYS